MIVAGNEEAFHEDVDVDAVIVEERDPVKIRRMNVQEVIVGAKEADERVARGVVAERPRTRPI